MKADLLPDLDPVDVDVVRQLLQVQTGAFPFADTVREMEAHRSVDDDAVHLMDLLAVDEPGEALLGPEDDVGVKLLRGFAGLEGAPVRPLRAHLALTLVVQDTEPRGHLVITMRLPECHGERRDLLILAADDH